MSLIVARVCNEKNNYSVISSLGNGTTTVYLQMWRAVLHFRIEVQIIHWKKNLLKPTLGKANVLIVKFPKSFRYVYEKDQWLKGVFANLFYRKGLCGKEHFTYKNYMSLCVTLADACLIWKQIWTSLVSSDLLIYINITEGVLLDEALQLIW